MEGLKMAESISNPSSYTMDYEKKEIILTTYTKDSQVETRLTKKDIKAMGNWFELAEFMEM
jgi:hypothetical protein